MSFDTSFLINLSNKQTNEQTNKQTNKQAKKIKQS